MPQTPIDPQDVAIADRGYKCLYSGIDFTGWKVPGAQVWRSIDWNMLYTGNGEPDSGLTTEKQFGDFGFIFDLRRSDASKKTHVLLRGSDKAAIVIDPADKAFAKLGGGWNRFEGSIQGDKMGLNVNGRVVYKDRSVAGAPARGPITVAPEGPTRFANVYVRKLK